MQHKQKPCEPNSKAPGAEGCGKPSFKRTYGLCDCCLMEWATTTENGKIWYQKTFLPRVATKVKLNQKKKEKAQKDQLTDWGKKLQDKVNEIVRLIDIGLPCLARGYHANQIHAGHVFARGGNQTIRFNLHNIHRQSAQSNTYQNDDGLLREGLVKEYGQKYFEFISELRQTPSLSYLNLEYQDKYQLASKIALKLKKEGRVFNLKERVETRNKINLELSIYDYKYCVA